MKDSDKNRSIVAEVIARAWRDPAYFGKLRQNPKLMLENAGVQIPPALDVKLLENTPTLVNVILPPVGDMAKYEARLQQGVQMLKDLPEDVEVQLHRDSATRAFIVIPLPPERAGELSDRQLESVVGGKGFTRMPKMVTPTSSIPGAPVPNLPPGTNFDPSVAVTVNNVVISNNIAAQIDIASEIAAAGEVVAVGLVVGVVAAVVVPCFIS
jgi:hypothetical protein